MSDLDAELDTTQCYEAWLGRVGRLLEELEENAYEAGFQAGKDEGFMDGVAGEGTARTFGRSLEDE